MQITVEFYGIVRSRAGVAAASATGDCLGDILQHLVRQFPGLGEHCIDGGRLRPGYMASVGGKQFVTSPDTRLSPGDVILLMSADAGG